MSHEPGPLGELGANLTGSAAGNYEDRLGDDARNLAETQGPTGRAADPLGRRDVDEEDAYADGTPLLERDEDADGAPEL